MKVVINNCYGGFGISHEATMEYARRKGMTLYAFTYRDGGYSRDDLIPWDGSGAEPFLVHYRTEPQWLDNGSGESYFSPRNIPRNDAALIGLVEEWGERANGKHASLAVVDIPDDVQWQIEEYDGMEWVAETHRTWHAND